MDVLFSLVGIALAISLYDYYTVKNWQQTTSDTRNDIVFDKRNKQYGAYTIRRDYNREMTLIILGVILTISAGYGSYLYFKSEPIKLTVKQFINDPFEYVIDLNNVKDDFKEEVDKPKAKADFDMVKSKEYVVTDDLTKGKKIDLLDLDKIPGPIDLTGKGDPGFKDPIGGGTGTIGGTGTKINAIVPTYDPDVYAEFPGGREKMLKYLFANLTYPEIPRQLGIQGKCNLQFVINKQGEISDIRIMRAVPDCVECDQEAIRVIKKMPKWKPAIKDGQKVDSYFMMPINFSLR